MTVNAAGTNAKPSMATWSPLTGAAGAVTDMDIIGMVSCAPAAGLEAEHPVTTSPTVATATECLLSVAIFMPTDSAGGYTA
ncbi:hypothetical protein MSIM_15390 [Mycobacterium simiae]|nr:hypothetical protein MSIM_15390 [Mycobacterium simiae]